MNQDIKDLLTGTFYIHEGFLAACALSVYRNSFDVRYEKKTQQDLIDSYTATQKVSEADATSSGGAGIVAIITFNQPVLKYDYGSWLGTQTVIKILDQFKADASVAAVVMNMDSGGGQVYGTPEYYDYACVFIETKPLVTYAGGYLCSGAYYMAAPTYIIANKRADKIGSIGAYGTLVDFDGIIAHFGGAVHTPYATNSTEKNDAYREAMKGDYKKYITQELDPIVATFEGDVIAVRPQIDKAVFKGGTWSGADSLGMGLVDELGTLDTAIVKAYALSQGDKYKKSNSNKSVKRMSTTKSLPHVQKALGVSGDLKISKKISGATGVFVTTAQLDALEAAYSANEASITAANGKVTTAEAVVSNLEKAVNTAITTADLTASVEANATTENKITLLSTKVVEYGKKPGAAASTPKSDGDAVETSEVDQDKSTSLFDSMR